MVGHGVSVMLRATNDPGIYLLGKQNGLCGEKGLWGEEKGSERSEEKWRRETC